MLQYSSFIMPEYQSFKGRKIDFSQKVEVYKNLHNGLFSVRQNGLVVAHVESIVLSYPKIKINEKGRQKVIKDKAKNVHAFITGFPNSVNKCFTIDDKHAITYNPYKFKTFVYKNGLHDVYPTNDNKIFMSVYQGVFIL